MSEHEIDPGLAGDRTGLSWTRSALNLAGNGGLLARAAFTSGLPVLGVLLAVALAPATLFVWGHGQQITTDRRRLATPGTHHQPEALRALTAVTVATALLAMIVTLIG